ncbi:MAG: HAMP domain-containing protein, partial [Magnetococcales bacterium]|nr:HAMP domain-containing protein [Magnetococcales bacterium]
MSWLQWHALSIRYKIMASSMVALLPLLAILYVSYNLNLQSHLRTSNGLLSLTTQQAASRINETIAGRMGGFQTMGQEITMGMAIEFATLDEIKGDFIQQAVNHGFAMALVADPQGKVLLTSSDNLKLTGQTIPEYSKLLSKLDVAMVQNGLEDGKNLAMTTMRFSQPIKDSNNKVNGLFVAYLNWQAVVGELEKVKETLRQFDLPDATIQIATPTHPAPLSLLGSTTEITPSMQEWIKQGVVGTIAQVDQSHMFAAPLLDASALLKSPVQVGKSSTLMLTAAIPNKNLHAKMAEVAWLSAGIGLVGTLVLLLISWLVATTVLRSIHKILNIVRAIAQGDLTLRLELPVKKDEVLQIADEVNHMADALANTVRTVTLQSDTISACVSQLTAVRGTLVADSQESFHIAKTVTQDNTKLNEEINEVKQSVEQASSNLETILASAEMLSADIATIASSSELASGNVNT